MKGAKTSKEEARSFQTQVVPKEDKYKEMLVEQYDEEVNESMNDVAALCISFLTVQACRFNISGVLPSTLGVEWGPEKYTHTLPNVWTLSGLGCGFAVASIAVGRLKARYCEEEPVPGSFAAL